MKLRPINNKKGITPVIAIVLLLMMTVAAAGAAFFWFIRLQSEAQGGTEAYQQQLSERVSAKVDIVTAKYVGSTLNIYLINHGNTAVPIDSSTNSPTTSWILYDSENDIVCSDNWEGAPSNCASGCNDVLDIGEIRAVALTLSGDCSLSSYDNNTLMSFTIDFSGITGTGGKFLM
jgi:flagellin-like protein